MVLCCDLWVAGWSPIPIIRTFRCAYLMDPGLAVAKIGLTETKLGIFPGAGGTQRLPRLVILTSRALTAHQVLECDILMQPYIRYVRN